MGEAAARELVRMGAEVHGVDIKPSTAKLASFHQVDLKDPRSIESAVKAIGGEIDALFNCAGLPQTFPALDVMKVNFIGMRYWTEQWLPRMRTNGAIATIASNAGLNFMGRLATTQEFLSNTGFDTAAKWVEDHPDVVKEGYVFSKEAIIVWTMMQAAELITKGIRVNCICPGPTATPMMPDFEKAAGTAVIDVFTLPSKRRSTPEEQAYPLLFVNSGAASYINGVSLPVDGGFSGAVSVGKIKLAELLPRKR